MDASLLRDECPMGIERPRDTEWFPVASTSDDGHEKVDCVRIMKEIPNGVENTGNPPSVLSTFLTPFLAPNPRSRLHNGPIVTGLRSFAAAVGSTR